MKKKLSLLLVLALIVSLVPMSAFAASDNYVDRVAQVKDDAKLFGNNAPILTIENDKSHWGNEETITLRLENANWLDDEEMISDKKVINKFNDDFAAEIKKGSKGDKTVAGAVYVNRRSDSRVEITVKADPTKKDVDGKVMPFENEFKLNIPMWVEMDGEAAKVSIESSSKKITEETKTFANGSNGNTKIYIDDTVDFSGNDEIKAVVIEETAQGTLGDFSGRKYIRLKLDKDFYIKTDGARIITLDGEEHKFSELKKGKDLQYELDKEELNIYITNDKDVAKNEKAIFLGEAKYADKIQIIGLHVDPKKDAKEGKVNLNVSANISEISSTNLEIGLFADYKVEVKANGDAREIFSGRYETNTTLQDKMPELKDSDKANLTSDEKHELQKLIIDEKVKGSWTKDKNVTVEFPTWVKIIGVKEEGKSAKDMKDQEIDENTYEFNLKGSKRDTEKVELTFYVSVEAGKEGDIEAKVGGRALDEEQKVVLGKAINPVKVEAEVAPLRAGVRDQEIGKLTITEVKAGAIQEDKDIILELDKDMDWDDEPIVKVTKGNLEIKKDDVKIDKNNKNILIIPVDRESTEASTVEITKSRVRVDRAVAEGSIKLEVRGNAIMANGYDEDIEHHKGNKTVLKEDYGFFDNSYIAKVEVANVITPADANVKAGKAVQFVIGSAEYKIGEEVKTADVAPYINNGRTMLPVRYVSESLGASSVLWNEATRTVTIIKGEKMAQITIGSNILNVGGMAIPMDTVAEIKDGRTMLPISYIATALGATADWDAATQTVTIK